MATLSLGAGATCLANQAAQTPDAASASSDKPHGPMPVELTKSLDSKKLKEGDPVTAKVTAEMHMRDGGTIPRGSTLAGHVTEAKARSKGDQQSALGIVFDKITTSSGKDIAVKGMIQAVAPGQSSSGNPAEPSGPGMMAGHEGTGAGTTPPPMPNPNQAAPPSKPMLNAQSKGVVGIRNLELGENSVLISSGKEVKLDSGTQMIVQVEFQ